MHSHLLQTIDIRLRPGTEFAFKALTAYCLLVITNGESVIAKINFILNLPWVLFCILKLVLVPAIAQTQNQTVAMTQQIDTFFNTPGFSGSPSTVIEDQLIRMLRASDASTKINISLYTFDRTALALEIIKAQARGASVELVLDDKYEVETNQAGTAFNILAHGAEGLPGLNCNGKSCITFCNQSCTGLWINHNKFFLFSQLNEELYENQNQNHHTSSTTSQFIVAQTSANMTNEQTMNYNDLIVIKNDQHFYEGMLGYWQRLKSNSFHLSKATTIEGQNGIKAYFFPRLIDSDPVEKILNDVRCDLTGSLIRVIQSRFDDDRDYLAEKLAQLAKASCDVKVIVRKEPKLNSPGKKVVKFLGENLASLTYKDIDGKILVTNSLHSKVLMINARMSHSTQKSTLVLTGSHNFNLTSLKTNDESLFKINDLKTFESYLKYWNQLTQDSGTFNFTN